MGIFDNPFTAPKKSSADVSKESGGYSSKDSGFSSGFSKSENKSNLEKINVPAQRKPKKGSGGGGKTRTALIDYSEEVTSEGKVSTSVFVSGTDQEISRQTELYNLQKKGYDLNTIYFNEQGQGSSIAPSIVERNEALSKNQGTIFVNEQGQGFSQNPDSVPVSIVKKPFGSSDITYASGRKEAVQTGAEVFDTPIPESVISRSSSPKTFYDVIGLGSFARKGESAFQDLNRGVSDVFFPYTPSVGRRVINPGRELDMFYDYQVAQENARNQRAVLDLDSNTYSIQQRKVNTFFDIPILGGIAEESTNYVMEKPVTIASYYAGGYLGGRAIASFPKVAKLLSSTGGKITLGGLYLGSVGLSIGQNPSDYKRIIGQELINAPVIISGFSAGNERGGFKFVQNFKVSGLNYGRTAFREGTAEFLPRFVTPLERRALFLDSFKGNTQIPQDFSVGSDSRVVQRTLFGSGAVDNPIKSVFDKLQFRSSKVEVQLTLGGKKTFGRSFYDDFVSEPRDLIPSTQQSMSFPQEFIISDRGIVSLQTGVKLKPVSYVDPMESSTSLKSTDFYSPKGSKYYDPFESLGEGVGRSERMFEGVDLKGISKSMAGSSSSMAGSSGSLSGNRQMLVFERPQVETFYEPRFVRKVGDTELNLDIQNKVTDVRYNSVALLGSLSPKSPILEKPSSISINISRRIVSPRSVYASVLNVDTRTLQTSYLRSGTLNRVGIVQRSGSRSIQAQIQSQVQLQSQTQIQKQIQRQTQTQLQKQFSFNFNPQILKITTPRLVIPRLSFGGNARSLVRSPKIGSVKPFREPSLRLVIPASLPEVFRYEARTGRESTLGRKGKKYRRIFEGQFFGIGNAGDLIPVGG